MVETFPDAVRVLQARLRGIYDAGEAAAIARLLLEHHTEGIPYDALLKDDRPMTEAQKAGWAQHSLALMAGKPLQQVVGYSWFFGKRFSVNEHTLIPRPETEELVALALQHTRKKVAPRVLDVGCGSGCIAIAIKNSLPDALVTAIDISYAALHLAKKNAADLCADVVFAQLDFLDNASRNALGQYEVIISNPPYIQLAEKESMHANVLRYEPHAALFAPDGEPLIFYKKIAAFAASNLVQGGDVFCELNPDLAAEAAVLFQEYGFETALHQDMQEKERMLHAWKTT